MRSLLGLLGAGIVCTAVIAACTGDDAVLVNPTGTDGGAGDGATGDGAVGDAGATAGSVLEQGDFEKAGCFGWKSNEATLTLDPDAHTGSGACRVCATGSTSVWGIFQDLKTVAPGGYQGSAFVQASGDAGPPLVVVRLQAFVADQDFGPSHDTEVPILDGVKYAEGKAEIEIAAGQGVGMAILAQSPAGCFLVDDATLAKR
jgi:hypothetical protein